MPDPGLIFARLGYFGRKPAYIYIIFMYLTHTDCGPYVLCARFNAPPHMHIGRANAAHERDEEIKFYLIPCKPIHTQAHRVNIQHIQSSHIFSTIRVHVSPCTTSAPSFPVHCINQPGAYPGFLQGWLRKYNSFRRNCRPFFSLSLKQMFHKLTISIEMR